MARPTDHSVLAMGVSSAGNHGCLSSCMQHDYDQSELLVGGYIVAMRGCCGGWSLGSRLVTGAYESLSELFTA